MNFPSGDLAICPTCGTQFDVPLSSPPASCRICDVRDVKRTLSTFTTLTNPRTHANTSPHPAKHGPPSIKNYPSRRTHSKPTNKTRASTTSPPSPSAPPNSQQASLARPRRASNSASVSVLSYCRRIREMCSGISSRLSTRRLSTSSTARAA